MRGQVTIEFILILVVMLVILATISLPTVERMEQDITDVGNAVNLVAIQNRIVNTAEDLSMASCNSSTTITVYITCDQAEANITWDDDHVWGGYYMLDGSQKGLKMMEYPNLIVIEDTGASSGPYWELMLTKDCSGAPTPEDTIGECI